MQFFLLISILFIDSISFAQGKSLPKVMGKGGDIKVGPQLEKGEPNQGCLNSPALRPSLEPSLASPIEKWCLELKKTVKNLQWSIDPCQHIQWQIGGYSVQGRPLVYIEIGDPLADNTTLIFATVHGDEITPFYLGLKLAEWLQTRQHLLVKTKVVIAPLVNPDGFLSHPRTRMNQRGVDINRNFPTQDWDTTALKAWKIRYKADPRRFPGPEAQSEPETRFQAELIQQVRPQKILSIHSPLNFLDYDGPSQITLSHFSSEYTRECQKLRSQLKAISAGFFPGSLGNYAGRELGIPTLTLELPSANPKKAESHWQQFQTGIQTMIRFVVPPYAYHQRKGNETSFDKNLAKTRGT